MQPTIIAGPCVIESMECLEEVAQELVRLNEKYDLDIIFKSSFDKANRTSIHSYRGPGLEKGMQMLSDIKEKYGLRILTDIHESYQAQPAGEVADVLQIPAFLCRQTDLLVAAARTGRIVNIKKAQFLSGLDMEFPVQKVRESGNDNVWLTERGNIYGYNNLAVDFRNIADMHRFAEPFNAMSARRHLSEGRVVLFACMALAAKAFGANGYFFEVHPDPDHALSDGPNMLYLNELDRVIASLID